MKFEYFIEIFCKFLRTKNVEISYFAVDYCRKFPKTTLQNLDIAQGFMSPGNLAFFPSKVLLSFLGFSSFPFQRSFQNIVMNHQTPRIIMSGRISASHKPCDYLGLGARILFIFSPFSGPLFLSHVFLITEMKQQDEQRNRKKTKFN